MKPYPLFYAVLALLIYSANAQAMGDKPITYGGEAALILPKSASPTLSIPYNATLPYYSLFNSSTYLYNGETLDIHQLTMKTKDLSEEQLGEILLTANSNTNAQSLFLNSSPALASLSKQQIESTLGTFYRSFFTKCDDSYESDLVQSFSDAKAEISNFGKNATLAQKILILQLYGSTLSGVFDASKQNQSWEWNKTDAQSQTNPEIIWDEIRERLEGLNDKAGISSDHILLMNEIAPLLGFKPAAALAGNRAGQSDLNGLYFYTADAKNPIAVLQSQNSMAIINYNSATDLADAISQVAGDHQLSTVIYDDHGKALKVVKSTDGKLKLKYLNYKDGVAVINELISSGKIYSSDSLQNSTVMASMETSGFRVEVREYQSLISDINIMFTVRIPNFDIPTNIGNIHVENTAGLLQEGHQNDLPYFQQSTNGHTEILLRHKTSFTTDKNILVANLLAGELYASAEAVLEGYHYPSESSSYNGGFNIANPILEYTLGGSLFLYDRATDGYEFSLSSLNTFSVGAPTTVVKAVGSIANYISQVLDEAHLHARASVDAKNDQFYTLDLDYAYTNLDQSIQLSLSLSDDKSYAVTVGVEKGFGNPNFPVFNLKNEQTVNADYKVNWSLDKKLSGWVKLFTSLTFGDDAPKSQSGVQVDISY